MQRHLRLKDLEQAAAKATRVAQISFGNGRALTCMYVTGLDSDNVKKASKVQFTWGSADGECEETHPLTV